MRAPAIASSTRSSGRRSCAGPPAARSSAPTTDASTAAATFSWEAPSRSHTFVLIGEAATGYTRVTEPMSVVRPSYPPSSSGPLFSTYELDAAYDEMFDGAGSPRTHCRALLADLLALSLPELHQHQA